MNIKKLLLFCVCAIAGVAYASASDFEYVGTNNAKVTELTGIGTNAYYLLYGNAGVAGENAAPGGYYAGIAATGETVTNANVWEFLGITDSTFYVYSPSLTKFLAAPAAQGAATLTEDLAAAATVLVKKTANIAGAFNLIYTNAKGKEFLFQDGGSENGMSVADNDGSAQDGKSDWFIYRADCKISADFPMLFTTANGLPAQTTANTVPVTPWKSPVLTSEEPVSSFRITVKETAPSNGNRYGNYVFFCMSELEVLDGDGNPVALTSDLFTTNALETAEGSIDYLCDGTTTAASSDNSLFFHSTWGNKNNIIAGEHYLEVTLPSPLYSFQFIISPRSNTSWGGARNYPCLFGLSKGGEAFDFYPSYGMTVDEQIANESVEAGKLYVMKSASSEEGLDLYPGYENGRRARKEARTDCVFSLVDAGDGSFYIKYYLRGQYVTNPTGDQNMTLVASTASAGKFVFGADGTIKTAEGYGLYMSDDNGLACKADTNAVWSIYGAGIDNSRALADLKSAIDAAQLIMDEWGNKYPQLEDGESDGLSIELTAANALYDNESATSTAILAQIESLNEATAKVRGLEILALCDSIDNILLDETFANEIGSYPMTQYNTLTTVSGDAHVYFETSFTTGEAESYAATMKGKIEEFWASIITLTQFPITIETGIPSPDTNNAWFGGKTQAEWTSPVFFLEEAVDKFRFTVIATNTGDAGGGYPCFALSEMYVYDSDGNALDLTVDNYATNAQEPNEGPLENICDGNTESGNFFHTQWSTSAATSEHYVEVTFPEPMYCFSFGFITRNKRTIPTQMVVSTEAYIPYDSIGFLIGDKVTAKADLNTDDYYVMYGNLNVVSEGGDGSGFYSGNSVSGFTADRNNLFQLEDAGEEGAYRIHFLMSDKYIAAPTGWTSLGTTYDVEKAGKFLFNESENLETAFKIFQNIVGDEELKYYMLQDWDGGLGSYGIADFEDDDLDGESDWYIYKGTFTANPDSVKMVGTINRALATNPVQGENPGCYSDISAYTAAFNPAVELRYNGGTNEQYIAATAALRNALNNLGEYIKPEIGKTYLLVSAFGEYLKQQNVEKAMYMSEAGLRWGNFSLEGVDTTNYWWTLESADTADVVYIKNYATQTYIGFLGSVSTEIPVSDTGTKYQLELIGNGQFKLKSLDGITAGCAAGSANCHTNQHGSGSGSGGNIVFWSASLGGASAWYLREVDPNLVELVDAGLVEVAVTSYYTLTGQAIDAPVKGINIVKTVYSDGSVKVKKILVK